LRGAVPIGLITGAFLSRDTEIERQAIGGADPVAGLLNGCFTGGLCKG